MTDSERAPPHRFEVLDSLRGVCACMVALLHFKTGGVISTSRLVDHSFLFVDFFFVLSGFVIAASYGERLVQGFPVHRFMLLRLGRIYPLHLVMLLAFAAFELLIATGALGHGDRPPFTGGNTVAMFLANLLLIHGFVGPDALSWNGPSWSIAVEMWTYLLFAAGFPLLRRAIVPVALLLAAACALYLSHLTDRYINVFHDGAFARCIFGFALGIAAFRLHASRPHERFSGAVATLVEGGAVTATIGMVIFAASGPYSLLIPPLFFLVVSCFAREQGLVSRALKHRFFLLVGLLSYSIYMIHAFLEYRMLNLLALAERGSRERWHLIAVDDGHARIGGSPLFGDMMSIAMLGLTIACAYGTYRFIEKPGQRWSRAVALGRRPRPSTAAAERDAPTF